MGGIGLLGPHTFSVDLHQLVKHSHRTVTLLIGNLCSITFSVELNQKILLNVRIPLFQRL